MITPLHPSSETVRSAAQRHREFLEATAAQFARISDEMKDLEKRIAALEQKQTNDVQTLLENLTEIEDAQKADYVDVQEIIKELNERTIEIETVLSTIEPLPPPPPEPVKVVVAPVRTAESTSRRSASPGLPLRAIKARVVDKT